MNKKNRLLKILIPVIIIAAGFGIMKFLIAHKEEPKKELKQEPGILVRTMKVVRSPHQVTVYGTGTVGPAKEISIIPQVSGRVVSVSPELKAGGFFKAGAVILEIENSDYVLALDQAKAAKAKAEFELATIRSKAEIARREWERISAGSRIAPNPLVTYEPQLKSAEAALASADASVGKAQLELDRTVINAPFNCRVRSENVDMGQYVRAGTPVAEIAGTDTAEISVPMSIDDMSWLKIPARGDHSSGSSAVVRMPSGDRVHEWPGRLIRSTGEVDPRTRMINLIVGVRDPYGLESDAGTSAPPLATGTFVSIIFRGETLKDVIAVPLSALRDGSTVWLMDDEGKLRIHDVTVIRKEKETAVLSNGMKTGDRIILSNISGAADGMKLREEARGKR